MSETVVDSIAERFERFLASVEPDRGGRVLSHEAITGGYSRISARAVVGWADGTEETFILRGDPPPGTGVFVSDRDAEVHLLRALPRATPVRTPVLRYYDATGEFLGSKCIVMEALVGATTLQDLMVRTADTPGGDLEPLTDLFIDTFAALHATPIDQLPRSLMHPSDWSSHIDDMLAEYDRMADEFPTSAPVLRHVRMWADFHRPPSVPLGLVHGDCQPTNVLMRPDEPPLVIDWEFGHIGDPRQDIGYYTQYPASPHAYWADPERFLARYRDASGLTEDQLNPEIAEYFLIFGMTKLLGQLLTAAAAIGTEQRPGILATFLINAISHQYDMFLSVCDRLS